MNPTATAPGVVERLAEWAIRTPDRAAVICCEAGGSSRALTFAELDDAAARVARALAAYGLKRGDRVALLAPPTLDFFSTAFALFKLGAVTVMADPGMGIRNLGRCLGEAAPRALIGSSRAHVASRLFGWARGAIRIRVTLGAAGWFGSASLDTLLGAVSERPFNLAATEAEETAAILFTSGATGPPKGAVYTHGMFAAQVEALREMFPPAENDVDLATFPLFALFDPALGVTAVVPEMNASRPGEADPEKLLRAIGERRATRMFGSPALIERLARFGRAPELRSLRCVLTAGAPVRADVLDRLAPMLDFTARIHTPYGATEALPVSSIDAREILGSTRGETERGGGVCIGRPVAGVRVELIRIADEPIAEWSDDLRVAAGEAGEIAVRGPVVSRKYWSRPEATALAKIAIPGGSEFFHRMGDVGRIDADGRLWFLGRKSHRVETAEGILHSVACEGIFNAHPSVRRTALVGVGKHGARRPAICIELEPSEAKANREEIAYKLKAMAKANPMTRAIRDFLFHPAFPVDVRHNAKIDRPRLAEWAARRVRR